MQPVLALLPLSDAFADVWARIAAAVGAHAIAIDSVAELPALRDACALLLAAGGEEEAALQLLEELLDPIPLPVAVVGTSTDYRLVASLCRAGANDYFAMPKDLGLLHSWLGERVEGHVGTQNSRQLHAITRRRFDFSTILGSSSELAVALNRAERIILTSEATILITGETGTGKDLLARAIHFNGPRSACPFVEINCAALPSTLLEAELFGYERGAFTDARTAKQGLIELAHNGTLFLDEIGDMPLELQAKLLRVLESGVVRRLGAVKDTKYNFRVIAATNAHLNELVQAGKFREDLYYRLNIVPINLPPLRERGDDCIELAESFAQTIAKRYGFEHARLSEKVKTAIREHHWPGNIRELKNSIERGLLLGEGILDHRELIYSPSSAPESPNGIPFPSTLEKISQAAALQAVEYCGGNKSKAARILGITRKYLYRLLEGVESRHLTEVSRSQ